MENKTRTRNIAKRLLLGLAAITALICSQGGFVVPDALAEDATAGAPDAVSQGTLFRLDNDGRPGAACPLKHTAVDARISGFLARVTVTQQFENSSPDKIEAVYVFPLPESAAVDQMTMKIGDRTVKGKIKRREEARAIYEAAKARGNLASLLDQERPNIFTQSVANIPPGARVEVTISYVEMLKYEEGRYEFSFPMVVGPRYIPGTPAGRSGGGWASDTNQVPDASRITPPVVKPGTRAGHDISLRVTIDAGLALKRIRSKTHEVDVERKGATRAVIRLRDKSVLPNKDFILAYDVAGSEIQDAVLTHRGRQGGFFTLILQPPERVTVEDVTPKELVFVIDTSGSMSGFPIEKAKEVIRLALNGLYPRDTFNLITFAGDTHLLFPEPVPATGENIRKARRFLASRRGGGGTEMMKAIRAALAPSDKQEHIRIVSFLTDGYVGNDMAILGEVQKHPNARIFSFGIGSSVNRFLLDKLAEEGRGEVEYVGLNEDGSAAARRFHERIRNPLLTDISIDWGGLPVTDICPKRIPDLFGAKPVIVTGRYTGPAHGIIRLRGKMSGREVIRPVTVDLPAEETAHDVLATLWARNRVDELMAEDWQGMQQGRPRPEIREAITQLGLTYRLMTQFTSFVAVEETVVTEGGVPRRIDVPVEMPEGVSYEGIFGGEADKVKRAFRSKGLAPALYRGAATAQSSLVGGVAAGAPVMHEEKPDQSLSDAVSKLHPELKRLAGGGSVAGIPVRDGKVEVEIWLVNGDPSVVARLKKLGLEVTVRPKIAKVVIGWVPLGRLKEISNLAGVRYVTPHRDN